MTKLADTTTNKILITGAMVLGIAGLAYMVNDSNKKTYAMVGALAGLLFSAIIVPSVTETKEIKA